MMVLSLVFALCPCLTCAQTAADDCCASDGPSINGACCVSDGGSRTAAPSTTVLIVASGSLAAHPVAIDATLPGAVRVLQVPTRPTVARAVLRI